jgi:carbamoyltransferase
MNILGISAYYHDSAAALVRDGEILAAAQEERFTRKKHDYSFPQNAIDYCLEEAGIERGDLDLVVFYDKPLLKFERILETYVSYSPSGFKLFLMGLPLWLKQKLYTPRELRKGLGGEYKGRFVFLEHHESHAASAFFPSPFEEAAILTMDGVGEWTTASIAKGSGNRIEMLKELRFPHSLGLLYSAFTYFTGFRVNSGEYKLMGLAPYGNPVYRDRIMNELLDLKEDGSFRMNMDYFAFCYNDRMTSSKMNELFDGPPRTSETEITQREMDIAASIQAVTEEVVLRMAHHAHELTGSSKLTMAGGVALNCVANGRVLREGPFARWGRRFLRGTNYSTSRVTTMAKTCSTARSWARTIRTTRRAPISTRRAPFTNTTRLKKGSATRSRVCSLNKMSSDTWEVAWSSGPVRSAPARFSVMRAPRKCSRR